MYTHGVDLNKVDFLTTRDVGSFRLGPEHFFVPSGRLCLITTGP